MRRFDPEETWYRHVGSQVDTHASRAWHIIALGLVCIAAAVITAVLL